MATLIDPQNLISQADDLLSEINQANLKFVDKTNQIITAINDDLKTVDKLNEELEQEEFKTLANVTKETLDYLAKSE